MSTINKADANPTKTFFVRMITRDITLEDCIFDLIDNSIDGAWEREGGKPMRLNDNVDLSNYKISLKIEEDCFSILDNCGGITINDAADYAFTFGRKNDATTEDFSIGVYGIGMKRAVFKLGKNIDIHSSYTMKGSIESFRVPIDVDSWLNMQSDSWDFDIVSAKNLPEAGVSIEVKNLTESATRSFSSPRFIQELRRDIARDYALHLRRGLTIEVNRIPIAGWAIELQQGDEFAPMRKNFTEKVDNEKIFIEIFAGMTAPPPDDNDPSDDTDNSNIQHKSGWYVVCNGRVVLAGDQTEISGWGTDLWPKWHPQYEGFMGIIFFWSKRADLLPLTTTKRSVDETSAIYLQFLPHMKEVSKEWISYTNMRKRMDSETMEKEATTHAVPIHEVQVRKSISVPKIKSVSKTPVARVSYSVPKERLRALADAMGDINMPQKDVGLMSFDHAYKDLVGEE